MEQPPVNWDEVSRISQGRSQESLRGSHDFLTGAISMAENVVLRPQNEYLWKDKIKKNSRIAWSDPARE